MNLSAWVRRVLRWSSAPVHSPESEERRASAELGPQSGSFGADPGRLSAEVRERMDAWLTALEAGCLNPPQDAHSRDVWDEYWRNQLKVGALDQGFSDQMSSETTLPDLVGKRGSRVILCAGNGLSTEAISLALDGFTVTALDISAVPGEVFRALLHDTEHPLSRIPGPNVNDDGSATFAGAGLIDPELCPPMHRSADYPPRGGGSLSFLTGDLVDPAICSGPFDVVIERRTLQLFPEAERLVALDRLIARLSNRGVFVSQQHVGRWRPGDDRTHYADAWLASRGFVMRSETSDDPRGATRLACLTFSSG